MDGTIGYPFPAVAFCRRYGSMLQRAPHNCSDAARRIKRGCSSVGPADLPPLTPKLSPAFSHTRHALNNWMALSPLLLNFYAAGSVYDSSSITELLPQSLRPNYPSILTPDYHNPLPIDAGSHTCAAPLPTPRGAQLKWGPP
eukprot:353345-Chlamydomonas_euryale.AAC.3